MDNTLKKKSVLSRKNRGTDNQECERSLSAITPDLARRIKEGDDKAFDALYLQLAGSMKDFHAWMLGSVEESEELIQNVFLQLWENRGKIDPEKNIKNYLFLIARNAALKVLRDKHPHLGFEFGHEPKAEDNYLADSSLIEEETRLLIDSLIDAMPKNRREVFKLYRDGFSYGEIALKLGTTEENVYQHVSRARKEIREVLMLLLLFMNFMNHS